MSRVTIQDIADRLGISKFAVSRALTGKPGVSDATRLLVHNAASSLGYTVKRKPSAHTIEVLFKDRATASRELWVDVQNGIDHESERNGCQMAVRWGATEASLTGPDVIGHILVGPHPEALLQAALASPLPSVVVNHIVPPLWPRDQVSAADVEAGISVARYLHDLGHRRVVYAHGRRGYPGRQARLAGFSEGIASLGGMDLREVGFSDDQAAGDLREALSAMVQSGFEPTAFFCGSDIVAVTILSELMRLGLRVPEDVSVIGHADYAIASQISPQLTTVHMPHREMGIVAVRALLARAGQLTFLDGLPAQRFHIVPNLVERQSSGPALQGSWRQRLRTLTSAP